MTWPSAADGISWSVESMCLFTSVIDSTLRAPSCFQLAGAGSKSSYSRTFSQHFFFRWLLLAKCEHYWRLRSWRETGCMLGAVVVYRPRLCRGVGWCVVCYFLQAPSDVLSSQESLFEQIHGKETSMLCATLLESSLTAFLLLGMVKCFM